MIVGVSILYDESPTWVQSAITSFAPICDAFCIIDGGYALYPGALTKPASDISMHIAILEAAEVAKRPVTLHVPRQPFVNNEVEKRNLSLDFARQTPGIDGDSWFLVFDGDNRLEFGHPALEEKLNESEMLVAEYQVVNDEPYQDWKDEGRLNFAEAGRSTDSVRGLYRNIPELTYEKAHYVLRGRDPDTGEYGYLWGNPNVHQPYAQAFDATDLIRVEHRHHLRTKGRHDAKWEYYHLRDNLGVESLVSHRFTTGLNGEVVERG